MKIIDLLTTTSISLGESPKDKTQTIELAVELMAKNGNISDKTAYKKSVLEREEVSSTGIGGRIAIPHAKGDFVTKPALAALTIPNGVDYDSLDGGLVNVVFLIAAPNSKDNLHLDVMAKLAVLLMDENFINELKNASTPEEFLSIISKAESEKDSQVATSPKASTTSSSKKLLAVTSCPTGIAHTYMAAESLTKAAEAVGASIKVETRGSGGAKNVLTDEEIAQADGIIVAANTNVPMDRFDGKKVIECGVADGIHKATELVQEVIDGNVAIYSAKNPSTRSSSDSSSSVGSKIYNNLMNGVSHMLPFVVGGGILIAIAFLIDGLSVDLNSLPEDMRGNFGSITPTAAMFKNIGGVAFGFMLPILAGYISMAIGDRPALAVGIVGGMIASTGSSGFLGAIAAGFIGGYIIIALRNICSKLPELIEKIAPVLLYPLFGILFMGLSMIYVVEPFMGTINTGLNNGLTAMGGTSKILLGVILAAMMATDMGGPFNKAAYVFGSVGIASGNYDIMAAVMIGGMVPPCAIGLATMLYKNKFTKEEREAGPANIVMGLSFITEGAIPFAAADPLRVLPACIISSGLAGGLAMAFDCTLMAPHGGIFVFPVVGNGLMYFVALAVSTVVGALLLGTFKKNVQ